MPAMEITWFGETCLRLRGREGVVVADGFRSVLGSTGRGMTADIVTYSHPEDGASSKVARPASLESAFQLDGPGEFEVHEVLIHGVQTFRDDARGADRGLNTCFVFELDGLHAVHLGDIGHLLDEERLGEIGAVDLVCVPVGSALPAAQAAELVAQLDAHLIVPMPIGGDEGAQAAMDRFLHEMSVQDPVAVPKLNVTISTVPQETTVVVLESRGKA